MLNKTRQRFSFSRFWLVSIVVFVLVMMSNIVVGSFSPAFASSHAPSHTPATASTNDPIVGDWNVTYGAPAVVTMSGSGGSYTETAKTPVRVVGSSCDLPPGTTIATFSGSGNTYSGQHGLWQPNDCSFATWTSLSLTLNGDTLKGVLGNGGTVTFTKVISGVIVSTASAIAQGKAEPGWPGGRVPYSWGGGHSKTPGPSYGVGRGAKIFGVDCSGFTRWVYYLSYGKDVLGPGNTNAQLKELRSTTSPQPGDLVFFGPSTTNTDHVGIYIGNGKMIDAPHTGAYVRISTIKGYPNFIGYYHYSG